MKPETDSQPFTCSTLRGLLPSVSTKWAMQVVELLIGRPHRFSELKRGLADVTQKSLTAALRELEKDGLITRTVTPSIPPRVDYELTPLGRSMLAPAHTMGAWIFEHQDALRDARQRFEDAS